MTIEVSRQDLVNLILSLAPGSYQACEDAFNKGFGVLNGYPNEKWHWDMSRLNKMKESTLYELYTNLKTKGEVN